jgi:hypothetical protein
MQVPHVSLPEATREHLRALSLFAAFQRSELQSDDVFKQWIDNRSELIDEHPIERQREIIRSGIHWDLTLRPPVPWPVRLDEHEIRRLFRSYVAANYSQFAIHRAAISLHQHQPLAAPESGQILSHAYDALTLGVKLRPGNTFDLILFTRTALREIGLPGDRFTAGDSLDSYKPYMRGTPAKRPYPRKTEDFIRSIRDKAKDHLRNLGSGAPLQVGR